MKEQEVNFIIERVATSVIGVLQPQLDGIQTNFSVLRTTLEQLEHAQAPKAVEPEQISRIMDAALPMLSRIMEATQPKSLLDQVAEVDALLRKLGLTLTIKSRD